MGLGKDRAPGSTGASRIYIKLILYKLLYFFIKSFAVQRSSNTSPSHGTTASSSDTRRNCSTPLSGCTNLVYHLSRTMTRSRSASTHLSRHSAMPTSLETLLDAVLPGTYPFSMEVLSGGYPNYRSCTRSPRPSPGSTSQSKPSKTLR